MRDPSASLFMKGRSPSPTETSRLDIAARTAMDVVFTMILSACMLREKSKL